MRVSPRVALVLAALAFLALTAHPSFGASGVSSPPRDASPSPSGVPAGIVGVPTQGPDLLAIASLAVALASLVVSYVVYRYTGRYNRSQVMIDFHRRFDELTASKYETLAGLRANEPTDPNTNPKVAGFIMRYWDMHYAEFVFWKQGLLQRSIYCDWLDTLHENAATAIIAQTTYADAWAYVKANRRFSPDFNEFMDCVFAGGSIAALERFASRARQYA